MPWREQWAKCFIDRYRNFGQRVNSPVKTAHKDLKSYLVTGTGDLLHLYTCIKQMLRRKDRDYQQRAAEMMMRQRREYIPQELVAKLATQISCAAIDLLAHQHRLVLSHVKAKDQGKLIPLCSSRFMQQYTLPYSHFILEQLEAKEPLKKEAVHPRWWLAKPLVYYALRLVYSP